MSTNEIGPQSPIEGPIYLTPVTKAEADSMSGVEAGEIVTVEGDYGYNDLRWYPDPDGPSGGNSVRRNVRTITHTNDESISVYHDTLLIFDATGGSWGYTPYVICPAFEGLYVKILCKSSGGNTAFWQLQGRSALGVADNFAFNINSIPWQNNNEVGTLGFTSGGQSGVVTGKLGMVSAARSGGGFHWYVTEVDSALVAVTGTYGLGFPWD